VECDYRFQKKNRVGGKERDNLKDFAFAAKGKEHAGLCYYLNDQKAP